MSSYGTVLLLITALLCNAAANLLVKYGMLRRVRLEDAANAATTAGGPGWIAQFLDPYFILGIICFGLNLLAYSLALKHFRLSLAYPIMVSGGYAIILLVSWFVFREKLSMTQLGGVGLILTGLWLAVR
ncbi:MAG: cation transporter [Candidatus Eisenbacteria bacterium]|uniref:Cation transporter n=1 Tax=Eiseniibacteriota bacterium TaxID=2212470 RepID=A0A956NHD0_UNCEI|nr:cation transporter [Candidatus Eisenbacteria bacterium]MCB9466158.1 cation transporter [Candidatus Eisenbacteria bacterium]